MAFSRAWNENEPDGDVVTVSQLDDADRDIKVAVRERLEGDSTDPFSGIFESGAFSNTARIRQGTARIFVTDEAAINSLPKIDGAMAVTKDTKKLFHLAEAAAVEIEYLNRSGARPMLGDFDLGTHLVKNLKPGTAAGHAAEWAQSAIINQQRTISAPWTFSRGAGLSPFLVGDSNAMVANLDADKLDGHHASDFVLVSSSNPTHAGAGSGNSGVNAFATHAPFNINVAANEHWYVTYWVQFLLVNSAQVRLVGPSGTSIAAFLSTRAASGHFSGTTSVDLATFDPAVIGADCLVQVGANITVGAASGTINFQVKSISASNSVSIQSSSGFHAMRVG